MCTVVRLVCEESTALGFPSPHEAQRSGGEGLGVGAISRMRDSNSPHPRPLPTARKSLRGEGSGEAVLTSHDQQRAMGPQRLESLTTYCQYDKKRL